MLDWLKRRRDALTGVEASARAAPAISAEPAPPPVAKPAPPPPPPATPQDRARAAALFQQGNQALARQAFDEAELAWRAALQAWPEHTGALANLGARLKDRGQREEAAALFERALATDARAGAAAFNLGLLHLDARRWGDAATRLRQAAAIDKRDADAPYWLGNALMGEGDASAARAAYQLALKRDAARAPARWGLAMAQLPAIAQTDAEQTSAVAAFDNELVALKAWFRARPAVDGSSAVGAQQPYYLAYVEGDHRARLADYGALSCTLMGQWARRVGVPAVVAAPAAGAKARRWRVGIVSSHLHSHSVWHALLRGWVEHLPPARFELHLFHTGALRDDETERAARRAQRLHHGVGDWKAWAKVVSDSQLDALIYPEIGMDATTTRLASLRLARVQLAGWGHPLTTGLPTIDGYISAEAFETADSPQHYSEKSLIALPRLGCCYQHYGTTPFPVDTAAYGIAPGDGVLLAAGTPFKYAPRDDALWALLAKRCAPCKLVFFRSSEGQLSDRFEQRLRAAFDAAGVAFDEHVRWVPWQSQAAFFGWLDRADVMLDTPGFSGFNTIMQAVERGTPIVAWQGRFMRGRFASAILRQCGLAEWVADSHERYVELVQRLCADAALRTQLRQQIRAAALKLYDDRASVAALATELEWRLSERIAG